MQVPVPQTLPSVREEALPGARVDTQANPEAFGGGQSSRDVAGALQNFGGAVEDYAKQERERADQTAHTVADTQASKLQTDIQIKVSHMKGQDAFGAQQYADQAWQDGIGKIRGSLNGRRQQMMFDQSAAGRYESLNKSVALHTSQQASDFEDQTVKSGMEQANNEAVVNAGDPSIVEKNADRIGELWDRHAKKYGIPEDSPQYEAGLNSALSPLHKDVIQARIDAGVPSEDIKKYFEDNKSEMTAGDILHTQGVVENLDVLKQGNVSVQNILSTKGMKFNDGSINVEKARDLVMAGSDLSDQKKEKEWAFVKARLREYNVDRNRTLQEHDRSFINDVITARKNNQPLDDAMKIAGRYAMDPYDQSMKNQAVQQIYAPPSKSDPATHLALWEGIQDGNVSKEMIDQAMNQNKINASDWTQLREQYYTQQADGTDPRAKAMNERVKLFVQQHLSDKQDQEGFLYELHNSTVGKSPDEVWKKAQDLIKDNPNTGIWGFFKDKQYKSDLERDDANNTAWGVTYDLVGKKQAMAIGSAILSTGKDKWNLSDVDAYAKEFGGADNIKQGTPANNAIVSLQAMGKRATPANVKTILERFPNGKAPPGSVR